ncbi:MAG: HAD-IA family hydrolase, partial [Staphylococcus sp.]|nr:HAD-IA family hydrolase [Staphylococcus sp.]
IATNTDQTIPKERGQAPGNGTLVAAVATASRRTPLVAGKPEAPIFHTAAQALNSERPVIVGDRLDTDILGANNAQMDGALVLTGV